MRVEGQLAPARASLSRWVIPLLIGRSPRRTLKRILTLVVLFAPCLLVFWYVLLPIQVEGPSMLPTHRDRAINFVFRFAYLFSDPKRGDVVAVGLADHPPIHPSIMYLKRVVGLPGETLQFRQGHVYIDGRMLNEPYLVYNCDWEGPPKIIPRDSYYLVGDNRSMLEDFHQEGRISRSHIVGKIVLCKSLSAFSQPWH